MYADATVAAPEAVVRTLETLVLIDGIELIALNALPEIDALTGLVGESVAPEILAPIN